jgi:hypothetical protein
MNDSPESSASAGEVGRTALPEPEASGSAPWLLLIHHLPPKPDYLRVKVRRRLERLGALPVKSSVYVLPLRPDTMEDFVWLAQEIAADGGEATICSASFLVGTGDDALVAAFRAAREADYMEIAATADALPAGGSDAGLERLARRLATVAGIDHFDSPARAAAEQALRAAADRGRGAPADAQVPAVAPTEAPRGRTWVTRAGVFVDRIASAWLIRRFIDPDARFAFVTAARYRPGPDELRFDMFEAEFTHEGERCTFEVLLARFGLHDPALAALGEIVHDIDCKDEKYGRPETAGVAAVLQGIAATTSDDGARIERGATLFDGLYATLGGAGR